MFELHQPYPPAGDQPEAIAQLSAGLEEGVAHQVMLGVTGSGKRFTMANVIDKIERQTLVFSNNKTLAEQLYTEVKTYFPKYAKEIIVSNYEYYQP